MNNLIKMIEHKVHRYPNSSRSFKTRKVRGINHLTDTVFFHRNLVMVLFLLSANVIYLDAQNAKEVKSCLQEHKIYRTPQLAGSNPAVKPAAAHNSVRYYGDISSAASQDLQAAKTSAPITWSQLKKQMIAAKSMLDNEVTVYSGISDQRSPQIVSDEYEKFVAFESDDIEGGARPYGTIKVYSSSDGGATWTYFRGLYNSSYQLTSPQVLLVGKDVVVSYLSNGSLWTYTWRRSDATFSSTAIPIPATSANEYVIDYRIVTDTKQYTYNNYLYMAFLFKLSNGKNKVLFSTSRDTARTWEPFITLGLSQSELGANSIGLDYSLSGLYAAYLGTDTSAGSILIKKSTDYGSNWTPEVKLPMDINGGPNKKVGPMIAAAGMRVAVIYQYDYYGDATDWKSGTDFDVYAIVSDDGGVSWGERMVNSTYGNEILPGITSDYDENFYVSFIRDGKIRVSMAGQEFAFSLPDSSSTANASTKDFPSIYGSTVTGNNTAYTTWTEITNSSGLDILGAETVLKIPPASPSNLVLMQVTNTEVKLTWTDNSIDELGFVIYYRQAGVGDNFKEKDVVGMDVTSYSVTGLSPSVGYDFYVRSFNLNGYSLRTNIETVYPAIVDNTPPTLNLNTLNGTPVTVSANGQVSSSPQVNATATDGESGVSCMQVAYRNTAEQTWSYSPYVYASSISFSIPSNKFVINNKPIGVNFRVGAWDNAGNVAWTPYASIDVKLGPQATDQASFILPPASQFSNKTTAYRLVSVPYNLTSQQPANLLAGFGNHSENNVSYARWRFQRYVNGQYQDYDQFSTENAVTPGAAFFFIVRDSSSRITVQGASIVRSDIMYNTGIALQNGWNLVGNPFINSYPIDSLEFYNTASLRARIRQHAFYSGTGPVSGWDTTSASVNAIQPWSGVALFVNSAGILKFPSPGQVNTLPKINNVSSIAPIEKTPIGMWTLAVNAYRSDIGMRCEGSSIGMAKGAKEGDDPYDSYIPPIVGDKNVAVYFKNADGAMMRDIRPLNDDGSVWEMKVVTGDADARVKLRWNDNLNLPNPAFEAYLIDIDQKTAYNLKNTQSLEIGSGNGVRNFQVVVGKKSFIEGNNAGVALTPPSMKLYANYPNPFNPETVIRYSIPDAPESYAVTLKVFNVLGQEIATLVNEEKKSGYYEVRFNGTNQSSGIYFYQISIAGGGKTVRDIKKMILMK